MKIYESGLVDASSNVTPSPRKSPGKKGPKQVDKNLISTPLTSWPDSVSASIETRPKKNMDDGTSRDELRRVVEDVEGSKLKQGRVMIWEETVTCLNCGTELLP